MKIMVIVRPLAAFATVGLAAFVLLLGPRLYRQAEQEAALERLQEEYVFMKWQALEIDRLRALKAEGTAMLGKLSAALPTKFEGEVEHVADAARRHRLRIESSPPGQEILREFYSMRGMGIAVTGRYHDLAAFVADVGRAPGCLRLQDISLQRARQGGHVRMQAVVWAYRFMDDAEVEKQRRDAAKKDKS